MIGWIRKEEYGSANAFFDLDISNSFVDPELKTLLELTMSEYHTDRLVRNLEDYDVHVRVGSSDNTVSPWYSRRIHRVLQYYSINSTLEEVKGKSHWWWDTYSTNDGGVMNDLIMRQFYSNCAKKEDHFFKVKQLYNIHAHNASIYSEFNSTMGDLIDDDYQLSKYLETVISFKNTQRNSSVLKMNNIRWRRCDRNVTLTTINPSTHRGLCGVQITQQFKMMVLSSIVITCTSHRQVGDRSTSTTSSTTSASNLQEFGNKNKKTCVAVTRNIRKLRFKFGYDSVLFGVATLTVDGVMFNLSSLVSPIEESSLSSSIPSSSSMLLDRSKGRHTGVDDDDEEEEKSKRRHLSSRNTIRNGIYQRSSDRFFEICWNDEDSLLPSPSCLNTSYHPSSHGEQSSSSSSSSHSSPQRSLVNYGPVRSLYNRPFLIVYGTSPHHELRTAMRDLAVYIANSHYSSHHTFVKVLSDLEYRSGGYMKTTMSTMKKRKERGSITNIMFIGGPSMNKIMTIICCNTDQKKIESESNSIDAASYPSIRCKIPDAIQFTGGYMPNANSTSMSSSSGDNSLSRFSFDGKEYDEHSDNAIIFTLPLYSTTKVGDTSNNNHNNNNSASGFRPKTSNVAMAVCLHSNTPEGYLHLSRLAWPVIPPMVRAPFTTYIPDYMLIDSGIWSKGFGGVSKAGYWDNEWNINPLQYYST